jgi:hypothetical protein
MEQREPRPRKTTAGDLTWWDRNRQAEVWVRSHPSDVNLLLPIFGYEGPISGEMTQEQSRALRLAKARAYHAMNRLYEQGKIKYHWWQRVNREGHPIHIWCGWQVKADTLKGHELPLSYFCRAYKEFEWIRGHSKIARLYGDTLPDAVMVGEKEMLVEYDSREETEDQYRDHMKRYTKEERRLLIVAPYGGDERLRQLVAWGEAVNHLAFYTTLDRAMQDPYGSIWVNAEWKPTTLPRPSGNPSR